MLRAVKTTIGSAVKTSRDNVEELLDTTGYDDRRCDQSEESDESVRHDAPFSEEKQYDEGGELDEKGELDEGEQLSQEDGPNSRERQVEDEVESLPVPALESEVAEQRMLFEAPSA